MHSTEGIRPIVELGLATMYFSFKGPLDEVGELRHNNLSRSS
jgi:hypothetical protein